MNLESRIQDRGSRAHSWLIVAGAISAIVIASIVLWLFRGFFLSAWLFVNGYDVHVHY